MSSPRELVVEALCTALAKIGNTADAPWETTPQVYAVYRNGLAEDGARICPFIVLTRIAETYTLAGYSGTSAMYDRVMSVDFTYAAEGWNAMRDVGPIVADVEKALGTDRRLGGTCSQCLMASNESQASGEECAVRFSVSIRYRTSDVTPTTRV